MRNLRLYRIGNHTVSQKLYVDKRGPYMALIGPVMDEPREWSVPCPKCKALAGWPCQSIRHSGGLTVQVYQTHKKRRQFLLKGDLSQVLLQRCGTMMYHNGDGSTTFVNIP